MMHEGSVVDIDHIIAASERLAGKVHETPILTNSFIDGLASSSHQDRKILFKCEHLQKTGAFKIRGATNALAQLTPDELSHGVVTHSSGNHAQALAYAAQMLDVAAYVVMPENSPSVKKDAVKGYGAEVTECPSTLASREETCEKIIRDTGAVFIHPYNDPRVIAGQGTLMLEFMEQAAEMGHGQLDAVLVPVGGGGMISGCAIACKALSPDTRVFGAEPLLANDAQQSIAKGERLGPLEPKSCADGLLTALGTHTFKIILDNVEAIFTVTEQQIVMAMRLVWERMKQVIETSAATGLAVALYNEEFRSLKGVSTIGVVLCGGNIQLSRAFSLLQEHQQL